MLPSLTLDAAVRSAAAVAAIGILWDTAEILAHRRKNLRFFDWEIVKTRYYILVRRPWLERLFDAACGDRSFPWVTAVHGAAAAAFVLAFPAGGRWTALLAGLVLLGHWSIHLRLLVGLDGADQMQTVVWAGIAIYALDLGPVADYAALGFVAAQLVLAYVVAGVAKVASGVWRRGEAVGRIMRAAVYSPPGLGRWMSRSDRMSKAASWSTMAFEVAAPALLLAGRPGAVAFLVLAAAFHLGIALTMGLTTFVFAFGAAFPIVYALAGRLG